MAKRFNFEQISCSEATRLTRAGIKSDTTAVALCWQATLIRWIYCFSSKTNISRLAPSYILLADLYLQQVIYFAQSKSSDLTETSSEWILITLTSDFSH